MSCDKEMSVSLDNANENLGVVVVDSMTINASTYQLLNLPSAGTGTVLVGKSTQPEIGSVKSSSYFRIILQSLTNDIPTDAAFDSVNLVVKPNASRYYYGDTTTTQKIAVHRVTEEIKTKNLATDIDNFNTPVYVSGATIFNDQKFNYDNTPLGTLSFNPTVRTLDTLSVKLDQAFGAEIFNKIKTNDWDVTNDNAFQQYIKGLVIVPDDQNTTILGLSDTVFINLNYSYVGNDGFPKTGKKVITSSVRNYQYNNIEYDRSGTPYENLSSTNREISSTLTNGELILQGGSGVVAKLDIPSLNEFMYQENIAVNKIQLIVETTGFNYGLYPNPSQLMLLVANKNGLPISYVPTPFSATIQTATMISGNATGVSTRYVFNLIDYIKNINSTTFKESSLLLSVASPSLFSTVNTASIATANGKPSIKLNIVYTKFK